MLFPLILATFYLACTDPAEKEQQETAQPELDPLQEDCASQTIGHIPEYQERIENGSRFLYAVPAEVQGILFLFHGYNGTADVWVSRIENLVFIQQALSENLLVVMQQSHSSGAWDPGSHQHNHDINNLNTIVQKFEDEGLITSSTPKYALGHSMGGVFITTLSHHSSFDGSILMNAPQHQMSSFAPSILTNSLYYAAENDETANAEEIVSAYEALEAEGADVSLFVAQNTALTPAVFHRIPGVDCNMSEQIFIALQQNWVLNNEGLQVIPPEYSFYEKALEDIEATEFRRDVLGVLKAFYASHSFSSVETSILLQHLLHPEE